MTKFLILLFALQCFYSLGQETMIIKGRIADSQDKRIAVPGCIVVNMRTQQGLLANEDGTFELQVNKGDTLAFRSIGYELKYFYTSFIDDNGDVLLIFLKRQSYQLQEVTIIPHRNLDSISKDIEKLGYDESEYMLQGVDAIESPFTYLYQALNRKERSRRAVAFMINEDQRRQLLRELLQYYVSSGYINLPEKEFNRFIDFCAINEAQLKTLTQYEMAVYIKRKHEMFR